MAKILVIDDEPGILDLLDNVLRLKGHEVILAERGRKGLKLFQQERPHVTILDLMMPEVGGGTVLREIRTLDPTALVIILTGVGTEERERQARELGAVEFLQKSFTLHTLGATLDRVLTQIGRTMMVDGRRQFPRFLIQFPISLLQDGAMIGDGTGCDLSTEGCAVASQASVGKGDHVALQLYLPDDEDSTTPLIVEVAAVRWTIKPKLGLEFISLPSGGQQRLRRYVRTLQTTSP
jgi:DNA-binding response OmpR family regulator